LYEFIFPCLGLFDGSEGGDLMPNRRTKPARVDQKEEDDSSGDELGSEDEDLDFKQHSEDSAEDEEGEEGGEDGDEGEFRPLFF